MYATVLSREYKLKDDWLYLENTLELQVQSLFVSLFWNLDETFFQFLKN